MSEFSVVAPIHASFSVVSNQADGKSFSQAEKDAQNVFYSVSWQNFVTPKHFLNILDLFGDRATVEPEGDVALTALQLKKLFGQDVRLFTAIGEESALRPIRALFENAGVELLPKQPTITPHMSMSLTLKNFDGSQKTIRSESNFGSVIKSEDIKVAGTLMVSNGLEQDIGHGAFNNLFTKRWDNHAGLIYMLSTNKDHALERANAHEYVLPSANLVIASPRQLSWTLSAFDETQGRAWLRDIMRYDLLRVEGRTNRNSAALIMNGTKTKIHIVTREADELIEPIFCLLSDRHPGQKLDYAGAIAAASANAAFIQAYHHIAEPLNGLPPAVAWGRAAGTMRVASLASPDDPIKEFSDREPSLAQSLQL